MKCYLKQLVIPVGNYSRTSIIQIPIIRSFGYPNAILKFKIPKRIWFSAKPSNKKIKNLKKEVGITI